MGKVTGKRGRPLASFPQVDNSFPANTAKIGGASFFRKHSLSLGQFLLGPSLLEVAIHFEEVRSDKGDGKAITDIAMVSLGRLLDADGELIIAYKEGKGGQLS